MCGEDLNPGKPPRRMRLSVDRSLLGSRPERTGLRRSVGYVIVVILLGFIVLALALGSLALGSLALGSLTLRRGTPRPGTLGRAPQLRTLD